MKIFSFVSLLNETHIYMNLLWLILEGLLTAIEYLITSVQLMITIIGILFGLQTLKMATLALTPFGKNIVNAN